MDRINFTLFRLSIISLLFLITTKRHVQSQMFNTLNGLHAGNLETLVTVATSLGPVTGKTIMMRDTYRHDAGNYRPEDRFFRNVTVFLGIPYARPPLRERGLRFQLPQPVENWPTWVATSYRPSCPQPVKYTGVDKGVPETNEDCLYLNIFTPNVRPRPVKLYPVIVHIHGGRFDHGSGNVFPGHMLASTQEIVVVTFNYRLGVLGYMATADNSSAGNYGLADQLAALHWVRDHIEAFNGDPQAITLWGSGSGAASAGLLAFSPRSQNLVRRVIAQSGSALADWAVQTNQAFVRNTSIVIGEHFGCYTKDTFSLMRCLESRAFNDFTNTEVEPEVGWLPFTHVIDSDTRDRDFALIPEFPTVEIGTYPYLESLSYMSGITRDDGSVFILEDEEAMLRNYHVSYDFFMRKLGHYVKVFNATGYERNLLSGLHFMYSPWSGLKKDTDLLRQGLIDMYTDSWALAGHAKMIRRIAPKVNTYAYVLNYTIEGLVQSERWMGVPYDTEYFLVSGAPFLEPKYFPLIYNLRDAQWTEADRNMSMFFMEAFANFARGGNPTPYAILNNILWAPTSSDSMLYLSINGTNHTSFMLRDYKQKSSQFWNEYVEGLLVHRSPYDSFVRYSPIESELRAYKAVSYAVAILSLVLLFIILLCSCLYCKAKSHIHSEANLNYMIVPNSVGLNVQYSPPSTRVNSESSLKIPSSVTTNNRAKTEHTRPRSRLSVERTHEKHTLV